MSAAGGVVKTGYLHIDGNEALGREPSVPHHWLAALAVVIIAQWVAWQASALAPYVTWWAAQIEPWGRDVTGPYVVSNLFFLVAPMALIAAFSLYFSRRIDGRGRRAIGLDGATAPLALVWSAAGVLAATPHVIALVIHEPNVAEFSAGFATLVPVTVIQAGAEEILFRGIILGFLCARYGPRNGIIISSLLFGLWHVYVGQSPIDAAIMFVSTFVFGVTASVLTLHYGNLGPALGLHVTWNVAAYLSGAASVGDNFWASWVATFATPWTSERIVSGELLRMLIIPLIIETLLIFGACRDTVQRLFGEPRAPTENAIP
jgi:membrane protease YdiL (CAAX protease family)